MAFDPSRNGDAPRRPADLGGPPAHHDDEPDAAAAGGAGGSRAPRDRFAEPPQVRDATDRLLGRPRTLRRREVSSAAGVPLLEARRFWSALGFPGVGDEVTTFTDADVNALRRVVSLVRSDRLDEPLALSMTRAIARTADHLAAWQASLLLDSVMKEEKPADEIVADIEATLDARAGSAPAGHGPSDQEAARRAGELLLDLVDDLEPLIVYAWRRHLSAALNGLFAETVGDAAGGRRTVGFADMVGFTTLVTRLSDQQLGRLVGRFEALAADVVTAHGGRVVKTVGDEVFFMVDRVSAGADIALDLLEALAEDPGMPGMRVGLATGEVLSHLGDVFGTTVNRASRVTEVALPDSVVVDDTTAALLAARPEYLMRRLRPRPLRGLGMTGMWTLLRSSSVAAHSGPARTVRHRPWTDVTVDGVHLDRIPHHVDGVDGLVLRPETEASPATHRSTPPDPDRDTPTTPAEPPTTSKDAP